MFIIFVLPSPQRSDAALGPTQPPIQWLPRIISPGVKRHEHEANYSTQYSTEVKNGGAITPLPPFFFMA
jgi:hypothetical protein